MAKEITKIRLGNSITGMIGLRHIFETIKNSGKTLTHQQLQQWIKEGFIQ